VSGEAADCMIDMKKVEMAESAEQLLAGTCGCRRCCGRRGLIRDARSQAGRATMPIRRPRTE
jgi:hypothetical protein